MITSVETLNFRCLRHIKQEVGQYQILVGPNASGKTTFLDAISFLGDLVSEGLEKAISERTNSIFDIFWNKSARSFELAIDVSIPNKILNTLAEQIRNTSVKGKEDKTKKRPALAFDTIRYEVAIGLDDTNQVSILGEKGLFKKKTPMSAVQRDFFPYLDMSFAPKTILGGKSTGTRALFTKSSGLDHYYSEVAVTGGGWKPVYKLGPRRSTFGTLIEEEEHFPVSSWLKSFLINGVQKFVLNSLAIRRPSPPGQVQEFKTDGSNLAWVIQNLKEKHIDKFNDWLLHIRTALPDVQDIQTVLRQDDYHRYIVIRYYSGVEVSSWMVSDGTLRLLALTIPAYLPEFEGVYLIEEPENGIHPKAMETITQSLSSVYDAQVLVATHSPVVLGLTEPNQVLCFAKTEDGATDIVLGSDHPVLREWKEKEDLGVLFAAGVLG